MVIRTSLVNSVQILRVSSRPLTFRAARESFAPFLAKRIAIARPIPALAPKFQLNNNLTEHDQKYCGNVDNNLRVKVIS